MATLLLVLGRGRAERIERLLNSAAIRSGLVMLFVGLALYGYVLRPHVVASSHAATVLKGESLKRLFSNSLSVQDLGALFTLLGIGVGIAGAALMAWRGLTRVTAPIIFIVFTAIVLVLHDKQVEPFYMFGARRFLIVVIPAFCLFAAHGLASLRRLVWAGWKPLSLACLGVLLLVPLARGRNVAVTCDYQGLTAFCRQVASLLPPAGRDRRVVLCDDEFLAAPLYFFHRENTLVIRWKAVRNVALLNRQIRTWQEQGQEVFYLSEGDRPCTREWEFVPLGEAWFESSQLEHTFRFFPFQSICRASGPRLFHLRPRDSLADVLRPGESARIHVGQIYFGIGSGFKLPEIMRTYLNDFRWTRGMAAFDLGAADFSPRVLMLRLAIRRPAREGDVTVRLTLNGETLPVVRVRTGEKFSIYKVRIPEGVAERIQGQRLTLALSVDTWSSSSVGVLGDSRDLGVMVDWIQLLNTVPPERLVTVDIGRNDQGRHAGVHEAEVDIGGQAITRWVRPLAGVGEMVIPWVETPGVVRLSFSLERGFTETSVAYLEILVDGQVVGNLALQPGNAVYQVKVDGAALPAQPRGRAVLGFRVRAGSGAVTDTASGLVAVEWVQVDA